ncbi:hypothetical protein SYNPS1DRAFT_30577 [Syncephalis pseudoplumigaleata]|uniref:F-box domain-containing protein n=1 Tax=Syncephalis pseudoplumigaleata TaxID=1712513 RepID=A0A4V1J134_9FUNG|nr:hypothetical protein SYNPS1DRAFT_30577 [Syncephalis pseudoplumigaleata]|eukprot:RKP23669.1 hypothetical protein SYNPS1DRAFT_30577 [Syncephalis pseudoplumigaleata]
MKYLLGPFSKLTALLAGEKPPATLDTPSQASLEACPPIATNAGAKRASVRVKRIYPQLVIECIAAYADTASLIVLASCCRQLWQGVRDLQHYWKQRYMQEHSFEIDEELSWLRWYITTMRASGLLASSASDDDINWFRAYCHRHACDANLFKNDPKRVKGIKEVTMRSRNRDIVLDRAYGIASLRYFPVFEYCQPKGGSYQDRYWRSYRVHDSDYNDLQRLDDNRFMLSRRYKPYSESKAPEDNMSILTVVSTRHSDGDPFIDNQQPVWTLELFMKHGVMMVPQDQFIIYTDEGWTLHSLSDGSILSFTSMNSIKPLLDKYCYPRKLDALFELVYHLDYHMICPSKDGKSLVAVDIMHPGRIKKREIAYLWAQHAADAGEPPIKRGHRFKPLDVTSISRHTSFIRVGEAYKMVDLSVQL